MRKEIIVCDICGVKVDQYFQIVRWKAETDFDVCGDCINKTKLVIEKLKLSYQELETDIKTISAQIIIND